MELVMGDRFETWTTENCILIDARDLFAIGKI